MTSVTVVCTHEILGLLEFTHTHDYQGGGGGGGVGWSVVISCNLASGGAVTCKNSVPLQNHRKCVLQRFDELKTYDIVHAAH